MAHAQDAWLPEPMQVGTEKDAVVLPMRLERRTEPKARRQTPWRTKHVNRSRRPRHPHAITERAPPVSFRQLKFVKCRCGISRLSFPDTGCRGQPLPPTAKVILIS